jgi:hypothetical protein
MNRREFIKISARYTACALSGKALPIGFLNNAFAQKEDMMKNITDLLHAMEMKDTAESDKRLKKLFDEGHDAWEIHLLLFPTVQRVLNPPFINPHLPKMYAINRELMPYLQKDDVPPLIRLEVMEYTRRSKLEKIKKLGLLKHAVRFTDIESAVGEQDKEKTATLMATFHAQSGEEELARRILLLGSGYLSNSLGHSISCTAFILQEMSDQKGEDLWPAFTTLADYFCKGRFQRTPVLKNSDDAITEDPVPRLLLQTTKGGGIVNLHHTITLYAMERVRHLFDKREYGHMIKALVSFMGKKGGMHPEIDVTGSTHPEDYSSFNETFSRLDAKTVTAVARGMITSSQGRRRLGRFLIKSLCEAYQGDYDPHYITGLGSALWAVDRYWNKDSAALNALFQYLDYLFDGFRKSS